MKRKLLILLIAVLVLATCFTACKRKEEQQGDATLTSIAVVEGSVPTKFNLGDTPDFSGIKVTATYDDGTTKELGFADVTISKVDTTTVGAKSVTVTYEGCSTKFEVTVIDPEAGATVTAIKIVPGSIAASYHLGQIPDYSGLQVEATYSTGRVNSLPVSDYEYTPIDTTTKGQKTFTVTYKANPTITYSQTVEVLGITKMSVLTDTFERKIFVGQSFATVNLQLLVEYEDEKSEVVEASKLQFSQVDTTTYGKKTLTITYMGVELPYEVEVVGAVSLMINNKAYFSEGVYFGDTFDKTQVTAVLTYSDDTQKPLTTAELTIGNVNTQSVGKQTLTASYSTLGTTLTATAEVTVIGVERMEIISTLANEILKGNAFDTSTLRVKVTYIVNEHEDVKTYDVSALTLGTIDVTTAGEKTLTITYRNKTIEHKVKVCEVTSIRVEDVPTYLPAGTPIDLTNMKVYGVYNNSAEDEILLSNDDVTTNVANIDVNSTNDKELVVTYNGTYGTFTTTVTITAAAPLFTGIEIRGYDAKIVPGGVYNKNSVVVYKLYGNGTSEKLTSGYTVSDIVTTASGNQTLTVSYDGKTASVTVRVLSIQSMTLIGVPAEIKKGETLITSGIQASVVYEDNTPGVISADKLTFSTFDVNAAGEQTLTVTYYGATATSTIEVCVITSIRVDGIDTTIPAGTPIDLTNMKVYGVYNNSTEDEILLADGITTNVSSLDHNAEGQKTLVVSYNGTYGEFEANVIIDTQAPLLTEIRITNYDAKIVPGGVYNKNNVVVYAYYGNGTNKKLTSGYTVSDIVTTASGNQTLTVTYDGKTASVTVRVLSIQSMTLSGVPEEVKKGETLITSGIRASVVYEDNTPDVISADKLTFGTFDVNAAGKQTLTVTYYGATATSTIEVCVITSIRVEGVDTELTAGTPIDLTNMKVYGVYNDKTESEILLADGITTNVANIEINTWGNKTLVVNYNGTHGEFSAEVVIYATAPTLSGITVTNYDKAIGLNGTYNKANIIVYATYENGMSRRLISVAYTVSDIVTTTAGQKDITITYTEGGITKTATIKVKVLPITKLEFADLPRTINRGTTMDLTKIQVIVTFSDGVDTVTRVVGYNDVTCGELDTETEGTGKKLKVTYLGFEGEYTYNVSAVKTLAILEGSVSTGIRHGYEVDYSGLIFFVTYTNGDEGVLYAKDLGDAVTYSGTGVGSEKFIATYEGKSVEQALSVVYVEKISGLNNTIPAVVLQGEAGATLPYDSFKLSVFYRNGDVYLIPLSDPRVKVHPGNGEFKIDEAGNKAIRIFFQDGAPFTRVWVAEYQMFVIIDDRGGTYYDEEFGYGGCFYTEVNVWVKGVVKVEIVPTSVLNVVKVGQTLDTANISAKVTYDDGSYSYVGTSTGLKVYSVDTSAAGDKTLVVEYAGKQGTMTVTVVDISSNVGSLIFGALLPDELVARESYAKNYRDQANAYRVGDDNPYYFYLNAIALDDNDNLVDIDGKSIATTAKIFLVEGGSERELSGSELTGYVSFSSALNTYDFTQEAVGKTFRLEIKPADDTSYVDETKVIKSQTVEIVDGWNIYNAYELNIITNTDYNYVNDKGVTVYQKDAATKLLAQYGIVRPEKLAGVVLHCNLDVGVEDIPEEYICTYTDKNTGRTEQGLYDHIGVFSLGLTSTQKTFNFYGNYFSVYSYNIPPVAKNGFGNNDDDFSSSDLFKCRTLTSEYSNISTNITADQTVFDSYKFNVQDLSTRDNDPNSNDQTASERHMRGIICFKTGANVTTMYNVNVEAYMTSMLVEDASTTANLNKVNYYNAWQGHLFLWHDNYFQEVRDGDNKAIKTADYVRDVVINITDSSMTKCGGPVIIAQNTKTNYAYNQSTGAQVNVTRSDLHTYVTGQEAWFVAVGQTQMAAQVRAMSMLITGGQGAGYTATDKIVGVETINMVMVVNGTGLTLDSGETYNATYIEDGVVALKMSRPDSIRADHKNDALNDYLAAQPGAPIFQTNYDVAGGKGIAFSDGKTGCYTTSYGMPDATTFCQGYKAINDKIKSYISLYYIGCGIVLEYYH